MKQRNKPIVFCLCLAITLSALSTLSGCNSTRTENGVTIEQKSSRNPLNYIPGF